MKKLLVILAVVMGMFALPAFAKSTNVTKTVKLDTVTSDYTKKKRKKRSYGVLAKVNLSTQRMHVYENGRHKFTWKISSGRAGYRTPTGSYGIHRMHKRYFSKKYHGAPMPYAMFFRGGYAVHGTGSIKRLGRTASHGCIRLHPTNAAKLFSMVRKRGGRVSISY